MPENPARTTLLDRGQGANTIPLDPHVMRRVGLGLADGHIGQADLWLLIAAGNEPRRRRGDAHKTPLVIALEHMRVAAKWLEAVARG